MRRTAGMNLGFALLVASLWTFAPPLSAQTTQIAASAGVFDPGGDDFENTDTGPGADAVVRLVFDRFDLGLGGQWNANDVPFSDDDWTTLSVFLEPRYRFGDPDGRWTPFVGGRLAWITQSIDVEEGERTTDGWGGGLRLGVALELSPIVDLEISFPFYGVAFGDFEIDGEEFIDTDSSGSVYGLTVGVAVVPGN